MLVVDGPKYLNIINLKNKNMNYENFKTGFNKPAIFTAETYGTKTTVEIDHCDLDLDEVMTVFQTLIVGMGYSNDSLKSWVLEKADEYKEDELSEKEEWLENRLSEDSFPHYVSNKEADEDYRSTLLQDSQRYEVNKRERGYITQALLDYVDLKGAVSYGELESYYKSITGSNSFSHILDNLRTPYKNRKTQRYLAKEGKRYSDAKYVVKLANPSNWIEIDY
jgi:hypothetical protein